jgi:CRISPR-associated exonuclease Cas4
MDNTTAEPVTVLVSMLGQYAYCPRRCALMFLEQSYEDNEYTLRGQAIHEGVDTPGWIEREGQRIEHALLVWHDGLGLQGKCDVVLFRKDSTPYPVEYKSGKRGYRRADDIQLCAQAMCLEEMFGKPVPEGAIYYFSSRKRRNVIFDASLREMTQNTIQQVRHLLERMEIPPPVNDHRCPNCSLVGLCLPEAIASLRQQPDNTTLFIPLTD